MNKFYVKNMIVFILIIILLALINNINAVNLKVMVGNYYINIASVLAALFLILINYLNNYKIYIMLFRGGEINVIKFITIFIFLFYYIGIVISFLNTGHLLFVVAITSVVGEVFLIISALILEINKIRVLDEHVILKIKNALFFLMTLLVLLGNSPFESFFLPVQAIVIAGYIAILIYAVFEYSIVFIDDVKV